MDLEELETAVDWILSDSGLPFQIKRKQAQAIHHVVKGKDTLCCFPTGFGKSLIFQVLPPLYKKHFGHESPIASWLCLLWSAL